MGWSVALAPIDHIDLVAMKDGHTLRIQVKSTSKRIKNHYHFSIKAGRGGEARRRVSRIHVDIVACAMIDIRRVYFMTSNRLPQSFVLSNKMLALDDMESVSWETALRVCGVECHEEAD